PMPRATLLERAATCDLGLSFMPTTSPNFNEVTMAGASNKAFEYLACGVPILVSDMPDWQRMFVEPGVAFAAAPGDIASLTRILRHAMEHRTELAAMGETGQELIAREWNYETQFGRVLEEIERQSGASKLPKSADERVR
ncbi:MAG: glycosyltransferase, partial [Gemmatimonadaceae bacterium]